MTPRKLVFSLIDLHELVDKWDTCLQYLSDNLHFQVIGRSKKKIIHKCDRLLKKDFICTSQLNLKVEIEDASKDQQQYGKINTKV